MTIDLAAFAAARRPVQDRGANALEGSVRWALHRKRRNVTAWAGTLVNAAERLMRRVYRRESGKMTSNDFRDDVQKFRTKARDALEKTSGLTDENFESRVEMIARWLSNAAINAGAEAAGLEVHRDPTKPSMQKTWITMHDDRVRTSHREVDGITVPIQDKFVVDGYRMELPGDPSAPPAQIINCRCVIAISAATLAASANEGVTMTATATEPEVLPDEDLSDEGDNLVTDEDAAIPWHGVLAPEDVMSGDGRKFGKDALRWRDLPLPLSWQKVTAPGHDGGVVVGRIDEVWRDGNLIKASGVFFPGQDEADEAIGLIADGGIRGVSVDVDDASMELQNRSGGDWSEGDDPQDAVTVFPDGRVCGATLCAIPAFAEAFVGLGEWPAEGEEDKSLTASCNCEMAIDEGTWDGSASNYTDEQYFKATIVHLVDDGPDKLKKSNNKLPILTPDGKLSRAGVHAAAGRLGSTDAPPEKISQAKAALRGAYDELGEDPPENIAATNDDMDEFAVKTEDGPGWLTHPVDTERLRRYWTRGKGAAKIRWGTPGDFNRCRSQLAKYVKAQYLNGYCANRHYDATGYWPGRAPSEGGSGNRGRRGRHSGATVDLSPAVTLVASARPTISARYFDNPHLTEPTPVTITEDDRIFGHLAAWGTCHIGIKGTCVTPPFSGSNYAHFRTGAVHTDEGDIAVGHVTLGTGHAGPRLSAAATAAHYDNTATVAADVVAGEDAHGIWISGRVRDHLSDEDRHALAAAPLSGDWREVAGGLEMVAALCVNVPGFLVPRTQLAASGGEQISLVAAGIVDRAPHVVSGLDISAAVMAAVDEIETRNARRRMMALRAEAGLDPKTRMARLRKEVV